jgi:hypothetical protein
MKSLITTILPLLASAASIRHRSPAPQVAGQPDLSALGGFDLSRLGPLLKSVQPYLATMSTSGLLAGLTSKMVPAIPLKNKIVLEPRLRKNAKRVKSRLGPLTLVAKGVSV